MTEKDCATIPHGELCQKTIPESMALECLAWELRSNSYECAYDLGTNNASGEYESPKQLRFIDLCPLSLKT